MTKTKIGVTKGKRSTHNLSCQNITTSDLFKTQPLFIREVFKGDNFNIRMFNINRVDALPVSSFVNINNKFHWFFVKMSQIWKPFDAFMTKAPYAFNYLNTVPTKTPHFGTLGLLNFFLVGLNSDGTQAVLDNQLYAGLKTCTASVSNASDSVISAALSALKNHNCDFVVCSTVGSTDKVFEITLTDVGRKMYTILYSLGYRIPSYVQDFHDDSAYHNKNNYSALFIEFSALPFMAYCSIYMNYFVPTKYRDYMFVNSMSYLVDPIPANMDYFAFSDLMDSDSMAFVERCYRLLTNTYYGSDYFTDSLVQPYAHNVGYVQDASDTWGNLSVINNVSTPTPVVVDTTNPSGAMMPYLDEYILSALKAVSSKSQISALTRNNMLASALQQFGYKPESSDMIPYLLKQINSEIVIEPEVSTAATDLAPLGYKAGCGVGKCKDKMSFDFDEYGFLICVNSISPDYFYSDGVNRELIHTRPEDYFDPAFVNLGFQPIFNAELRLLPSERSFDDPTQFIAENVFGFQNKYAEFGYKRDFMGGDFCVNTMNQALDSFHFKRDTDFMPLAHGQNTEQFAVATYGSGEGVMKNQFDRIFGVESGGLDHIQQWTYFKILAHRSIPANGEWTVGTEDDNSVEGVGVTDNINN